jgi:hypothetical protein
MSITKEQWEQIEQQLSGAWGQVELVCDGYKISAAIGRISPLKYGIEVYVDGFIKGEWVLNNGNSEIPRKFHCEKKRYICNTKMREFLLKQSKSRGWPKERREAFAADAKKTHSHWLPYWTSAKAFCRHIRKTCSSIEIVKIGF